MVAQQVTATWPPTKQTNTGATMYGPDAALTVPDNAHWSSMHAHRHACMGAGMHARAGAQYELIAEGWVGMVRCMENRTCWLRSSHAEKLLRGKQAYARNGSRYPEYKPVAPGH
jgi:hypothetical protein